MRKEWRKRNPERARELRRAQRERARRRKGIQPKRGRPDGQRWSCLKQSAKRRGLELSLQSLPQGPCYWCGGELPATGSGVDRLDNERGYVEGNVVACCTTCNLVRGSMIDVRMMEVLRWEIQRRVREGTWGPPKVGRKSGVAW